VAADALKREIETIADLVVCAAALVDRQPPLSVHADLGREDDMGTYRAGKVVQGRRLLRVNGA
jgi:hypothetical protein